MRQILLCTHGNFASGCKHSLELIAGTTPNVSVLGVQMEDTLEAISNQIADFVKAHPEDDKIILTDIPGGSPTQAAFKFIDSQNRVYVVTGLNLGLLLELVLSVNEDVVDLLRTSLQNGKDTMQFLNDAFVL